MKKKICLLLAAVLCVLMSTAALAEGTSKLNDFANRLKKVSEKKPAAEETAAEPVEDNSYGPALRIDDPFFQKVRSSAYLQENDYSREANVMIEVKNVSGRTLYPDEVSIIAYNAAGEVIDEETYANYGPDMVADGGSLFIWDWFYGFDAPIAEISYFEVKVESETSSYNEYAEIDAQALVSEGIAYALVENTLDGDIYGVSATIAIENEEGNLLDVCSITTGNAVGVFPGSVLVLRDNAKDYAADQALMQGSATAYVLHQLD